MSELALNTRVYARNTTGGLAKWDVDVSPHDHQIARDLVLEDLKNTYGGAPSVVLALIPGGKK